VAFREAIKEDGWGGREQADIAFGAKELVNKGFVTPRKDDIYKVGITGTSYGGFSAWSSITQFPNNFAASAPVCGMTDLFVDYETTRPDLRPYSEEMMGGSPKEVPERYRKGSPINFLEKIKGEILIVQGLRDPNVSPENVRVVEEKLQEYGINYEKLVFDDEGHGIVRKKNQRIKIGKIADFFEKYIK
jgi:dipeptidyl aminopeptidase/acylaminoacyl peptidase